MYIQLHDIVHVTIWSCHSNDKNHLPKSKLEKQKQVNKKNGCAMYGIIHAQCHTITTEFYSHMTHSIIVHTVLKSDKQIRVNGNKLMLNQLHSIHV